MPPVARQQLDFSPSRFAILLPERRELAGLEHQHAVARRQRVDERRFPGAGARRGIDHDRLRRLEDRASCRASSSLPELAELRARDGRSSAAPMARSTRSGTFVGPGICRKWRPCMNHRVRLLVPFGGAYNTRPADSLHSELAQEMPAPHLASLQARLRREIEGDVLFDADDRGRYATDASIYQIEPLGVVVPRTAADAQRALADRGRGGRAGAAARRRHVAVRPDRRRRARDRHEQAPRRACSSSTSRRRHAWVEPGLVLDELNARLKPHGLWYPVDVSTSAQATLGGMTGNNSLRLALAPLRQHGAQRARGRDVAHERRAVTFGAVARDGASAHAQSAAAATARHDELVALVRALHERERDEIAARLPQCAAPRRRATTSTWPRAARSTWRICSSARRARSRYSRSSSSSSRRCRSTRRSASCTSRRSTRRWTLTQHIVKLGRRRSSSSTAR